MVRSVFWMGAAAALAAALPGQAEAATVVHALTISGQASGGAGPFGCATSGPLPTTSFHGGGVPVPAEGHAGCGLKGGIQDVSKASGLSVAHSDVTNPLNGGVNTASADAKAEEGTLGAQAGESYTSGYVDSRTYLYSEAGAIWTDTLDYSGAGAGMAYMRWRFDIDGLMSVTGSGDALTRLRYQVGAEPIYTAFVAELGRSFTPRAVSGVTGAALSGFTVTPTSISGADSVFTYYHLVDLTNPFDVAAGLYTAAYSGPNSAVVNDSFNTAKLTGIELVDLGGNPLDVSFMGASGTFYAGTGAHRPIAGVPEPSQWALMILGFGLVGLLLRQPGRRLDPRRAAVDGQFHA
jgi:hypothetical protein